jgi:hypothetical protein
MGKMYKKKEERGKKKKKEEVKAKQNSEKLR